MLAVFTHTLPAPPPGAWAMELVLEAEEVAAVDLVPVVVAAVGVPAAGFEVVAGVGVEAGAAAVLVVAALPLVAGAAYQSFTP